MRKPHDLFNREVKVGDLVAVSPYSDRGTVHLAVVTEIKLNKSILEYMVHVKTFWWVSNQKETDRYNYIIRPSASYIIVNPEGTLTDEMLGWYNQLKDRLLDGDSERRTDTPDN